MMDTPETVMTTRASGANNNEDDNVLIPNTKYPNPSSKMLKCTVHQIQPGLIYAEN